MFRVCSGAMSRAPDNSQLSPDKYEVLDTNSVPGHACVHRAIEPSPSHFARRRRMPLADMQPAPDTDSFLTAEDLTRRLNVNESVKRPKAWKAGPSLAQFDFLTLDQVAHVLHISKAHVSNVIAGGVEGCSPIPVLHLGRRRLVRRTTLELWMKENDKIAASPERGRKSA
jgi:hypothetical protein